MDQKNAEILIVDDEQDVLEFSISALKKEPYNITPASSEREALELLKRNSYELLITDRSMESRDSGIHLLKWVRENTPETGVIIVTSYADVANAVEAMKAGALDYIEKPFNFEAFKIKVRTILDRLRLEEDHRKHLESYNTLKDDIVGSSSAIKNVLDLTEIFSKTDSTVLVTGETGSGKELVAKRIHALSPRADKLFVECNTGAIGKEMIRSDLFGHVKGAFTGAVAARTGKFELAHGGTIFLDEIGEMDLDCQTYLLRVLETKKIEKMGSSRAIDVDVRVIAGTNRNLQELIREGRFREDLYYRLAQLPIEVPPLRERREDIIPIAEYFLKVEREVSGQKIILSKEAKKAIKEFDWPGNVRMLKNRIHLAAVLAMHQGKGEIEPVHLNISDVSSRSVKVRIEEDGTLDEFHNEILSQMLRRHGGNKREVSRVLGITEATVHNWLRKFKG